MPNCAEAISPGPRDTVTAKMNESKPEIMGMPSMHCFINVMKEDGSGSVISVVALWGQRLVYPGLVGDTTPMTREDFNAFCASLKATIHVVQWGNADVWKVGGKVFAICGWNDGKDAFTFKATDLAYEVLQDQPGIRPAPYLASRGMKWLQVYDECGMSDASLRDHIVTSYEMVVAKLTKKMRAELGL